MTFKVGGLVAARTPSLNYRDMSYLCFKIYCYRDLLSLQKITLCCSMPIGASKSKAKALANGPSEEDPLVLLCTTLYINIACFDESLPVICHLLIALVSSG
jgi:hypothetical protein